MKPPEGKRRRLFFALWPDAVARRSVRRARRALRPHLAEGRWVPESNWHITLAFLGSVPDALLAELCRRAAAVAPVEGELLLDRLEHWPRPRVLCLTSAVTPAPLIALADSLAEAALGMDIPVEERPYRAHLTLVRALRRLPVELPGLSPVSWAFGGFTLVESAHEADGPAYRVLARWGNKRTAEPRSGAS